MVKLSPIMKFWIFKTVAQLLVLMTVIIRVVILGGLMGVFGVNLIVIWSIPPSPLCRNQLMFILAYREHS